MTRLFSVLVLGLSSLAAGQTSKFLIGKQAAKDGMALPYRPFVPKNYDSHKSYPLVLAQHGAGERGTDDSLQFTTHLDTNRIYVAGLSMGIRTRPFPWRPRAR